MMRIPRSGLRLLRRPYVATSLASTHRLSSPSRSLISFMASVRWWPTELARRVFPIMAAPIPTVHRVFRFSRGPQNVAAISRVKGNESGKPCRIQPISSDSVSISPQGRKHSVIIHRVNSIDTDNAEKTKNIETRGTISSIEPDNEEKMKNNETRGAISEVIDEHERSGKDTCRSTTEVIDGARGQNVNIIGCKEHQRSTSKGQTTKIVVSEDEEASDDERYFPFTNLLARSRHRDGSIYRGMDSWWKEEYHVTNRNETRLEAMMFSDPTNCTIRDGFCRQHYARRMLQIFSLELAEICLDGGLVELYGYIAVRDGLDPLLNYVVNFSRDDPIIVEQGSLINVTGPKRGIVLLDAVLIEYDMRIKTGKQEEDDLQLIDGATLMGTGGSWDRPFMMRIPGDCGVIGINLSRINYAVEATIEVHISEVQSRFNLSLRCLTSGLDEEICLFDGVITQSRGLKRSVVAVVRNSLLDLKFEIGTPSPTTDKYRCCFKAKKHGNDIQNIKTYFALISVRVTWSTLPSHFPRPRD